MTRLFWYIMLAVSGGLIGLSLSQLLNQRPEEMTIYLLFSGLILSIISAWGLKNYAGIGFFAKKTHK